MLPRRGAALAQALPAMASLQLPCVTDQVFIDECMSYVASRMEQEPPAVRVCRVANCMAVEPVWGMH
eukprot:23902-Pelagomonas_calceolata.AAC.1